jgi:uncharacterized protein
LDRKAAINERDDIGDTALWLACYEGRLTLVRLLLESGADPTIATKGGETPLMVASSRGHLDVLRFLLGDSSAKNTVNYRYQGGETALLYACVKGHGGVARALLESGADPTIADRNGITPMIIAKTHPCSHGFSAEGRRECAAALEVRSLSSPLLPPIRIWPAG